MGTCSGLLQRHKVHSAFGAIPRLVGYDLRMHRAGEFPPCSSGDRILFMSVAVFRRHHPFILSTVLFRANPVMFDLAPGNGIAACWLIIPLHQTELNLKSTLPLFIGLIGINFSDCHCPEVYIYQDVQLKFSFCL